MVAALLLAVTVVYASAREPHDPLSQAEADQMAAAVSAAEAAEAAAADVPRVTVIGDSYTEGSNEGGTGLSGWPAIVAGWLDVRINLHAAGGAGYAVQSPSSGKSFMELANDAAVDPADVIVVFGSRNDSDSDPQAVQDAAAATFSALRAAQPGAVLVVIGPAWSNSSPPNGAMDARGAVEAAASDAGATFVDPLALGWFYQQPYLIGDDDVHPTNYGHVYLAEQIEPVLSAALRSRGAAG